MKCITPRNGDYYPRHLVNNPHFPGYNLIPVYLSIYPSIYLSTYLPILSYLPIEMA